jgi:hypothetical protein
MEMQGSMRRGDELVVEETRTIVVAAYTAAHIELLLETAGFGDIQMLDNWTDAPATADTANITFVAPQSLVGRAITAGHGAFPIG